MGDCGAASSILAMKLCLLLLVFSCSVSVLAAPTGLTTVNNDVWLRPNPSPLFGSADTQVERVRRSPLRHHGRHHGRGRHHGHFGENNNNNNNNNNLAHTALTAG